MVQRLTVNLTPKKASVMVEDVVARETSAATMAQVIDNMQEEDLTVLLQFCDAVSAFARRSDRRGVDGLVLVRR
jgi:hypothetical protein